MIVDEFYTVMHATDYVYVAGKRGLATAKTPRKTMSLRGDDAVNKLKGKIRKARTDYMRKEHLRIVKVTVEEVGNG